MRRRGSAAEVADAVFLSAARPSEAARVRRAAPGLREPPSAWAADARGELKVGFFSMSSLFAVKARRIVVLWCSCRGGGYIEVLVYKQKLFSLDVLEMFAE